MKEENIRLILKKVAEKLEKKNPDIRLDPYKWEVLADVLRLNPYEDGFMRVQLVDDKSIRLVPFEDIIVDGLKGADLEKYSVETSDGENKF